MANVKPITYVAGEFAEKAQADWLDIGGGVLIGTGAGSPEGVHAAPVSSQYHRTDGGTNTALYRKESGAGNTGWVAVSNAGGGGSGLNYQAVRRLQSMSASN